MRTTKVLQLLISINSRICRRSRSFVCVCLSKQPSKRAEMTNWNEKRAKFIRCVHNVRSVKVIKLLTTLIRYRKLNAVRELRRWRLRGDLKNVLDFFSSFVIKWSLTRFDASLISPFSRQRNASLLQIFQLNVKLKSNKSTLEEERHREHHMRNGKWLKDEINHSFHLRVFKL